MQIQIKSQPEKSIKVPVSVAAGLIKLSPRVIRQYCDEGVFKTARKIGLRPKSPWEIDRSEVMLMLSLR